MVSPEELQTWSIEQLLTQHSRVLSELRRRRICRSSNNPTGDYTEWLVASKLGLELEANSSKGFDAVDRDGLRYQIKGRRQEFGGRGSQLSAIRGLQDRSFDVLIAVMFAPDWSVKFGVRMPYDTVCKLATFKSHVNGHIMHLRPGLLSRPGVQDITAAMRTAPPVQTGDAGAALTAASAARVSST